MNKKKVHSARSRFEFVSQCMYTHAASEQQQAVSGADDDNNVRVKMRNSTDPINFYALLFTFYFIIFFSLIETHQKS